MAEDITIIITESTITATVTGGATWDSLTGKPTATAENSFLVSGATPFAWAERTLAQVKTILGLGLEFQSSVVDGGSPTTITLDATTYKDFIISFQDLGSGAFTLDLTNTSNGDAGMIVISMDSTTVDSITLGSMFTKQLGTIDLDVTSGKYNVLSWRKVVGNIIYTIQQAQ